jgi:hypothetical protein
MHVVLTTGLLFFTALTLTLHTSTYVFAQNATSNMSSAAGNQTTGNQSSAVNMSAGAVGSSEQLSQVLGNNTELIENKTAIGNTPGPIGNLTASSNNTLGQIGQNAS